MKTKIAILLFACFFSVGYSQKPTTAYVLDNKGLSFMWQDQLHVKNPDSTWKYTSPDDLFQPNRGLRSGAYNGSDRRSFVMNDAERVLKIVQLTDGLRHDDYATGWWPNANTEFGMAVDVYIPTNINLDASNISSYGATDGKTSFGILCGEYDVDRPNGGINSSSNVAEVVYCKDQKAAMCFINWTWRKSTGNVEFSWYHYAVGKNGVRRDEGYTTYPNYGYPESKFIVPRGRWFTFTIYGKMDTNGLNGVLEAWIDDTMVSQITGLDLGGAVMDRGYTSGTGSLVGKTGGGWKFHVARQSDMVGGTIYNFTYGADPFYYARNFRVYGNQLTD